MTLIALSCVDKWGRRKFLMLGASLMAVGILTLGLVSHLNDHADDADPCSDVLYCNVNSTKPSSIIDSPTYDVSVIEHFEPNIYTNMSQMNISSNLTDLNHNKTVRESHVHIHGSTAGKVAAFSALMLYVAAFGLSFGPGKYLLFEDKKYVLLHIFCLQKLILIYKCITFIACIFISVPAL